MSIIVFEINIGNLMLNFEQVIDMVILNFMWSNK